MKLWPSSGDGPGERKESRWFSEVPDRSGRPPSWRSAAQTITFDKFGESSYSSKQIHGAMNILEKAYLLSLDYPVTSTSLPALPAKRRSPKLIMLDRVLEHIEMIPVE